MKKLVAMLLATMMVFALCACGQDETETEGMANPVHECSYEELVEVTGIDIAAPEAATDVTYSYIDMEDADPIAQVQFTFEGHAYNYRCQSTTVTSLMTEITDQGATIADDLIESLQEGINVGQQLAGIYYDEWSGGAAVEVQDREGIVAYNDGEAGFIAWLDVVPGFMYSLSMNEDCTQDLLMTTADEIFVPMQGEVG